MNKITNFLFLVILAVSLFYLNGCTVIGIGIGAISDISTPDTLFFSKEQLSKIEVGEKATFQLENGKKISGIFLGFKRILDDSYKYMYYNFTSTLSDKTILPKLSEHIVIHTNNNKLLSGKFVGLSKEKIFVLGNNKNFESIKLKKIKKVSDIKGITFQVDEIKKIVSNQNFPIYNGNYISKTPLAGIVNKMTENYFSSNEIKQVTILNSKNGVLTGAIVGGVVDIVVIAIVISNGSPVPSHCCSSLNF